MPAVVRRAPDAVRGRHREVPGQGAANGVGEGGIGDDLDPAGARPRIGRGGGQARAPARAVGCTVGGVVAAEPPPRVEHQDAAVAGHDDLAHPLGGEEGVEADAHRPLGLDDLVGPVGVGDAEQPRPGCVAGDAPAVVREDDAEGAVVQHLGRDVEAGRPGALGVLEQLGDGRRRRTPENPRQELREDSLGVDQVCGHRCLLSVRLRGARVAPSRG